MMRLVVLGNEARPLSAREAHQASIGLPDDVIGLDQPSIGVSRTVTQAKRPSIDESFECKDHDQGSFGLAAPKLDEKRPSFRLIDSSGDTDRVSIGVSARLGNTKRPSIGLSDVVQQPDRRSFVLRAGQLLQLARRLRWLQHRQQNLVAMHAFVPSHLIDDQAEGRDIQLVD